MRQYTSLTILIFIFLLLSCAHKPINTQVDSEFITLEEFTLSDIQVEDEIKIDESDEIAEETEIIATFEDIAITKKTFIETKSEIELVVESLNIITYSKDYDAWLTFLSDEYVETFSNKTVLEEVSASLPIKNISLRNLKDYFNYVFVPSRQNMRVDDIQFVSPTRVYVIMEIMAKSPAAIYIIEKQSSGWKLVPKNQ